MKRLVLALSLGALALVAQQPKAAPFKPTEQELQQIRDKAAELEKLLKPLQGRALVEDVAVYHKAAEWILRHPEEFFRANFVADTLTDLDHGIARAKQLAVGGQPAWTKEKGRLVRAYRSKIDGSIQPYALVIPDSYDGVKPVRLDVILHGRADTMNEVTFISTHERMRPIPPGQDFIELEVWGRGNNAFRWSGDTDTFEALESVQQRYKIDPNRIVLRGFSMGGAGAWQTGLHYPGFWAAMEAGAGFTETKRYARRDNLPPYQEATLHIYDAVDYSLNAFNLPSVGYGGEDDPQLQAAVNIKEQLVREGLRLPELPVLFLVAPKTGHQFHPDSKKESEEFIRRAIANRKVPDHVRFVTYTTRYNKAYRITVDALEKHFDRAEIDLDRGVLKTRNVARFTLTAPIAGLTIDGQKAGSGTSFEKQNGKWVAAKKDSPGLQKRHGLQGPIDDAFMDSFLCVRPTGTANNPAVSDYAVQALEQFRKEHAKWLRGDVRVKDDSAVTKEDIANHNLVLFGDPGSNRVLAKIADRLPMKWTKDSITAGGRQFAANSHLPVMIYPNPLNPKKYVVINSGHTFHERDFRGTNALLYPRLGDYAVLQSGTGDVALAGLFDEHWR